MDERSRAFGRRAAGDIGTHATRALAAAALILTVLAGMWLLEAVDLLIGGQLDHYGIRARDPGDLPEIFTAPFLHGNFDHLIANTIPFAALGFLAALRGIGKFLAMNLIVIVIGGLGVWFTGPPNSETLGASILVFGYFGYLLGRGVFERHLFDLLVAVGVVVLYGGIVYGVFPSDPRISWQGHLFGLIGGLVAAFLLRRRDRGGLTR
ncbi:rhomboid family intramembrane serine protease [Actinocorallia sp. A-T 12471]|uniref:rhomboid family intramembrane serine protease n=1 Tax=Actinocorallia sp. A-T 12471 TaxID=3089813 RepID=UPI0029D32A30|nr:rhomboid family intramembrane serine protease [Actinocorallia sp. A-T 12471]MDX6741913.1 rhomboid family intramembrane serine protease [Actinocorallia sp. A-T 12471]